MALIYKLYHIHKIKSTISINNKKTLKNCVKMIKKLYFEQKIYSQITF